MVRQLEDVFEDKISIKYFKERKELLANDYRDNELHFIIVPKHDFDWASTFARQEREENKQKVKIFVYGLFKRQ